MYTLPFAIVGTANFTALPAVSFPVWLLFHNMASVSARNAYSTAGPSEAPALPYVDVSTAHITPFVFPSEEATGVQPGKPNEWPETSFAVVDSNPLLSE